MEIIDTFSIPGFREPVSSLTHLLAGPIFACLGYSLVRRSKHWGHALTSGDDVTLYGVPA